MERDWPDQFKTKPAKDILAGMLQASAPILSYQEQVDQLTGAGFALWDVVRECGIKNSDDTSIKDCIPNDIRGLIEQYPTITKIVFASGKTSAKMFAKLNKAWLKEGQFNLGGGEFTVSTFSKNVLRPSAMRGAIQLVVPFSVSPAAAAVRFAAKRDQWLKVVFNVSVDL